jgi:hypothetical protein
MGSMAPVPVALDLAERPSPQPQDARGAMDRVVHLPTAVDPHRPSTGQSVRGGIDAQRLERRLASGTDREEVRGRATAAVHAGATGSHATQLGQPVE